MERSRPALGRCYNEGLGGGCASEAVCVCTDTSTCVHTHTDTHRAHSIYQPAAQGLLSVHIPHEMPGKPFPPIACMLLPGQSRKVAPSSTCGRTCNLMVNVPGQPRQPPAALKSRCSTGPVKTKHSGLHQVGGDATRSWEGDPDIQPENTANTASESVPHTSGGRQKGWARSHLPWDEVHPGVCLFSSLLPQWMFPE